jgi:hypothetical protein
LGDPNEPANADNGQFPSRDELAHHARGAMELIACLVDVEQCINCRRGDVMVLLL